MQAAALTSLALKLSMTIDQPMAAALLEKMPRPSYFSSTPCEGAMSMKLDLAQVSDAGEAVWSPSTRMIIG